LPRTAEDIIVIPQNVVTQPIEGQVLGTSVEKETINVPIKNRSSQVKKYIIIGLGTLVVIAALLVYRKFFKKSGEIT